MNNNYQEFLLECDCGCKIMRITRMDGFFSIDFLVSSFYKDQQNLFSFIINKIKFIWYILRGKEFQLHEIVLTEEKLEEFKKFMDSI